MPLAIICYFRDKLECALWFAETYGLLPESLIVEEKETGLSHEVQFSPGMASDVIKMVRAITNTLNIQIYYSHGYNNLNKMFKSLQ